MKEAIIWHNPKCSKSRECLKFLEDLNSEGIIDKVIVRLYLKDNPSFEELKDLLRILQCDPLRLVRVKEPEYQEGVDLIKLMIEFPKLIERPIVFYQKKAVIGRPLEEVKKLFN